MPRPKNPELNSDQSDRLIRRVRSLMKEKEITAPELANKLGVSFNTFATIERKKPVSLDLLRRIEREFEIEGELFGLIGVSQPVGEVAGHRLVHSQESHLVTKLVETINVVEGFGVSSLADIIETGMEEGGEVRILETAITAIQQSSLRKAFTLAYVRGVIFRIALLDDACPVAKIRQDTLKTTRDYKQLRESLISFRRKLRADYTNIPHGNFQIRLHQDLPSAQIYLFDESQAVVGFYLHTGNDSTTGPQLMFTPRHKGKLTILGRFVIQEFGDIWMKALFVSNDNKMMPREKDQTEEDYERLYQGV